MGVSMSKTTSEHMSNPKPLSSDAIENLLKAPQREPRSRKANDLTKVESRTYTNWFTLRQEFANCNNPACTDTRPSKVADGTAMCINVNGIMICRLCFLDGFEVALDNG